MKISTQIEQIFSTAVAMDQSGGLRNTIFVIDREIYILNYDHTLMVRFRLRRSESPFQMPISFRANDYDSDQFTEDNGKIIFTIEQDGFTRRKICGVPDLSPSDAKELFEQYWNNDPGRGVNIPKSMLSLLERDLSHTEFRAQENGPLQIIQRNIYSGALIEITKNESDGGFVSESAPTEITPIAIKTDDLIALFQFQDVLNFRFMEGEKGTNYIQIRSLDRIKRDMNAVVACCLYDEIIEMREAKNGW